MSLTDYVVLLGNHDSTDFQSSLLLYGNDLEIFDYRPGNSDYLYKDQNKKEILRIEDLYKQLDQNPEVQFVLPGDLIDIYKTYEKKNSSRICRSSIADKKTG
jgi:hypothetical protein